jgi:hypothetical protein
MAPGIVSVRLHIPVTQESRKRRNMPIDAVLMPGSASMGDFPLLIEAKSAGDDANTKKRLARFRQLRNANGEVTFVLLPCGYFDPGYPGMKLQKGSIEFGSIVWMISENLGWNS